MNYECMSLQVYCLNGRNVNNALFIFRAFWFVATFGAIGVFIYMLGIRLNRLINVHPKSVLVEVTYGDRLPFPSVMICNQNFFR